MPTLPILPMRLPTAVLGQANGRLPASVLTTVRSKVGGADIQLVDVAARAWSAMVDAALADGHVLKVGWATNAYRPYADQERIFRARYVIDPTGSRYWKSQRWRKKAGVAAAAVPGTSNHGWGLAVDIGEERDGDPGTESLDAMTLEWLIDQAGRFGFSAELQSEPWHWRYIAGDRVPPAVELYEALRRANNPTPNEEEEDMRLVAYIDPKRNRAQVVDHVGQKVREIKFPDKFVWNGPAQTDDYISDMVDDFDYTPVGDD